MPPITAVPPHYHESAHIVLTADNLLVRLNLLSLIPVIIGTVVLIGWWLVTVPFRPVADISIPWLLGVIGVIVIVLPLHELIHGLVIIAFGYRARFGMKLSKGVLYATAENALFPRDYYIAVALAPLVVITLLAMLLMAITPSTLSYYIGIAAVLNAGGAIGDLWTMAALRHYPRSALVRDEADGFRVYTPSS